jgi:hypothetical protein
MNIDDLKSNWDKAGIGNKDRNELSAILDIQNHPQLKKIQIKLVIEIVLLIAFLATYNNIFDGADKPQWVNITLLAASLFYMLTDFLGYLTLRKPVQGENIKESLQQFYQKLDRVRNFSLIGSSLFGLSVLMFFATGFAEYGVLKFTVLFIGLLFMMYLLHRNWALRTKQIKKACMQFKESPDAE